MGSSIKDPLRRGHNRNNLWTKDTLKSPKCSFSNIVKNVEPLKSGEPLYKGTKWLVPTCPLFRGSTVIFVIKIYFPKSQCSNSNYKNNGHTGLRWGHLLITSCLHNKGKTLPSVITYISPIPKEPKFNINVSALR